jgi:hypothetical protein
MKGLGGGIFFLFHISNVGKVSLMLGKSLNLKISEKIGEFVISYKKMFRRGLSVLFLLNDLFVS